MVYVVGKQAYCTVFDNDIKAYPRVDVIPQPNGTLKFNVAKEGISKLPENYEVCDANEIYAKFGKTGTEVVTSMPSQPKLGKGSKQ